MFIAYTDASVKNNKASLAFFIVFEDKSIIRKRILVNETKSSVAEAMAFNELLSFLNYYGMKKGLVFFDAENIMIQLKHVSGKKQNKTITNNSIDILEKLQIITQLIPRKLNVAHKICYADNFQPSSNVSSINRSFYSAVPNYPEYYMKLSVLSEYRQIYEKQSATLYEAQMKLNKIIWLAEMVEVVGDLRIYEIYDKRITVYSDIIININRCNYIRVSNYWKMIRKRKKLKKILNSDKSSGKNKINEEFEE
ncbi:hypothetical protein ACQKIC_16200 [Peribacillus sp. NPDC046944]|uniref:hypothetical protein n=1 Tax=unclassified Peribacillus TaxID=2675266 RepID=UPI0038201E5D